MPLQPPSLPPPSMQVTCVLYFLWYRSPYTHIYEDIYPSSGLFGQRVLCEYQILAFLFVPAAAYQLPSFLPIPPPPVPPSHPPSLFLLHTPSLNAAGVELRAGPDVAPGGGAGEREVWFRCSCATSSVCVIKYLSHQYPLANF